MTGDAPMRFPVVWSRRGEQGTYHLPNCRHARRADEMHSWDELSHRLYRPCGTCKPEATLARESYRFGWGRGMEGER